jgi:exopolyphosphatase / guanosine-5'-triphosphate,3'-diphosphate pyrophosphatase
MIVASIDIGTNTVLLLVARIADDGTITPLLYEQRVPRLGKGVDALRRLSPEAMRRVAEVLAEYRGLMKNFPIDSTAVCATSAVRDAANRGEFIDFIMKTVDLTVEVLTGADEALWTYRGAISGLRGVRRAAVVDIGGGSTEVTVGNETSVTGRVSVDIGAVRLTERILRDDPPTPTQLEECVRAIDEGLKPLAALDVSGSTLIGVAGTATSLALLHQGRREFDLAAISGYRLPLQAVEELSTRLMAMPSAEIGLLSAVLAGRADIITAGALILRMVMEKLGNTELLVSERGVRYGLALREWMAVSGGSGSSGRSRSD